MDIAFVQHRLESGESLKIKYRYPLDTIGCVSGAQHGVRSDRLVDVSVDLSRFYVRFRGVTPIWLVEDEVIEIIPDDGVYEDFAAD
jgi:hypothetical protein